MLKLKMKKKRKIIIKYIEEKIDLEKKYMMKKI